MGEFSLANGRQVISFRVFKTDLRVFVVSLSKDKSLKLVRLSGSSSVAGGFKGALLIG